MNINSNLNIYGSIKGYDNSNPVTEDTTFDSEVPLSIKGGAYIGNGLKVGGGGIVSDINGDITGSVNGSINAGEGKTAVTGNIVGNVQGKVDYATEVGTVDVIKSINAGTGKTAVTGNIVGNVQGNITGTVGGVTGSISGSVASVGDTKITIVPSGGSEINFGGSSNLTTIYFGKTAVARSDGSSRPVPVNYYFGASSNDSTTVLHAGSIYGAVWNDIADCIDVDFTPKAGYCYCYNGKTYKPGNEGLVLGVNSDTYGFALNKKESGNQLTIGVAGYVLAVVDKVYKPGTPLKANENGILTKAHFWEKNKIIARYFRKETSLYWGPQKSAVEVKNRIWVKIE